MRVFLHIAAEVTLIVATLVSSTAFAQENADYDRHSLSIDTEDRNQVARDRTENDFIFLAGAGIDLHATPNLNVTVAADTVRPVIRLKKTPFGSGRLGFNSACSARGRVGPRVQLRRYTLRPDTRVSST